MCLRRRLAAFCLSIVAVPAAAGDVTEADSHPADEAQVYAEAIAEADREEQQIDVFVTRDQRDRTVVGYRRSNLAVQDYADPEAALSLVRKQPSERLVLHAQEGENASSESLECARQPTARCVLSLAADTSMMFWDQLDRPDALEFDHLHSFLDGNEAIPTIGLSLLQWRPYFRTSEAGVIVRSYGLASLGRIDEALEAAARLEDPADRGYVLSLIAGRLVSWITDPDVERVLGPLPRDEARNLADQAVLLVDGTPGGEDKNKDINSWEIE